MCRIYKVQGNSLYPDYQNGDFVLITKSPFPFGKIKLGDIIVFTQTQYGILIKKVKNIDGDGIEVIGSIIESTGSQVFGKVNPNDVMGKVVWHIRRPRREIHRG